jgi:hypothetical protein
VTARRASTTSRYQRPSRRGALIGAVVVVLASIAVAIGLGAGGDDDDGAADRSTTTTTEVEPLEREGSVELEDAAPLPAPEPHDRYRMTYRVSAGASAPTVEVLTVDRPFTSELVTKGDDGDVRGIHRWAFGRVITAVGDEDPTVFAVGPNVGGYDFHARSAVDEAVESGLLERREQREVIGRRCQVYRTGTSVSDGVLAPVGDVEDEYADVCIDADGLLLEEWWVLDGHAIRQRLATELDESVPDAFGDGWVEEPTSMPVGQGGGSVRRLRPGSAPPGDFFEAPSAPEGFTHLGRYTVVPPQAIDMAEADSGKIVASTADVWVRGGDVVVLDQGGTRGGVDTYPRDPDNRTVEIAGVGTAEIVLGLATNEVRIQRDVGKFVRVIGTLTSDELLAVARSLVLTEGNEIVLEDGPLLPPGEG